MSSKNAGESVLDALLDAQAIRSHQTLLSAYVVRGWNPTDPGRVTHEFNQELMDRYRLAVYYSPNGVPYTVDYDRDRIRARIYSGGPPYMPTDEALKLLNPFVDVDPAAQAAVVAILSAKLEGKSDGLQLT